MLNRRSLLTLIYEEGPSHATCGYKLQAARHCCLSVDADTGGKLDIPGMLCNVSSLWSLTAVSASTEHNRHR